MDNHIFVFHQGALGDFILALQAIGHIASKPRLDICCQQHVGAIALHLGLANQAFSIERGWFSTLFSSQPHDEVVRLLARYDGAMLFTFSEELYRNVSAHVSGPVYRIPPRPQTHTTMHIVDFFLDRIGACIPLVAGQKNHVAAPSDRRSHSRTVIMHPGSGSLRKNWPLEKFIALSSLLTAHGFAPHWILGPAEHDIAVTLETTGQDSPVHRVDDLIHAVRILHSGQAFVGNDSGLSHLAAFLDIPTTAIFGPSNPVIWSPRGPAVSIVSSSVGCEPCFEEKPPCATLDCLNSIEPEVVLQALVSVIR